MCWLSVNKYRIVGDTCINWLCHRLIIVLIKLEDEGGGTWYVSLRNASFDKTLFMILKKREKVSNEWVRVGSSGFNKTRLQVLKIKVPRCIQTALRWWAILPLGYCYNCWICHSSRSFHFSIERYIDFILILIPFSLRSVTSFAFGFKNNGKITTGELWIIWAALTLCSKLLFRIKKMLFAYALKP